MEFALIVFGIGRRPHPALRQLLEFRFQLGTEAIDVIDAEVDVLLATQVVELTLGQRLEEPERWIVAAQESIVVGR